MFQRHVLPSSCRLSSIATVLVSIPRGTATFQLRIQEKWPGNGQSFILEPTWAGVGMVQRPRGTDCSSGWAMCEWLESRSLKIRNKSKNSKVVNRKEQLHQLSVIIFSGSSTWVGWSLQTNRCKQNFLSHPNPLSLSYQGNYILTEVSSRHFWDSGEEKMMTIRVLIHLAKLTWAFSIPALSNSPSLSSRWNMVGSAPEA